MANSVKMRILAILLLFATFSAKAQLPVKDGKVTYEVIDSVQGTKNEIYGRAKLWLATAFKDAKEVIQADDKDAGEIVGKGSFRFSYSYFGTVECLARFTLKISARDQKYRAIITDILVEQGKMRVQTPIEEQNDKPTKSYNKKILENVEKNVTSLLEDLQKKMRIVNDGF